MLLWLLIAAIWLSLLLPRLWWLLLIRWLRLCARTLWLEIKLIQFSLVWITVKKKFVTKTIFLRVRLIKYTILPVVPVFVMAATQEQVVLLLQAAFEHLVEHLAVVDQDAAEPVAAKID